MLNNDAWTPAQFAPGPDEDGQIFSAWVFADLALYRREERESAPFYVTHLPSGVEFAPFATADAAALAGEIAYRVLPAGFADLDDDARRAEGAAVIAAWMRAGLHPSAAVDEIGCAIWNDFAAEPEPPAGTRFH